MRYYDIANEIRRWWDEKSILLFFGCISGFYCSLHDFNIKGNMMAAILIVMETMDVMTEMLEYFLDDSAVSFANLDCSMAASA